jgi:hypothetical protein
VEVFFNQYAYGVLLTMNLDFDPSSLTDVKLEITDWDGVSVTTATEADAELNLGLGEVPASSGIWPVTYAFRANELDTVGWYRAVLFMQNAGNTVGRVLQDGMFEVRAVPGTPLW